MDDYSKLKVSDLKALLRARGLPVGGTKPVLLARLEAARTPGTTLISPQGPPPQAPVQSSSSRPVPPPLKPAGVVKAVSTVLDAPPIVKQVVPLPPAAVQVVAPIAKKVATPRPAFKTPFKAAPIRNKQTDMSSSSQSRLAVPRPPTSISDDLPRYPPWLDRLQCHLNAYHSHTIVLRNTITAAVSSNRQYRVALRFLLSRIYTVLMTNPYPLGGVHAMEPIVDCVPIIDGISSVSLEGGQSALFIEATGEVIGREDGADQRLQVRADWRDWIEGWTTGQTLMDRVKTSDEEMYPQGISTIGRRTMGEAELEVAITFVLSHATPSSISGTWYSTSSEAAMVSGVSSLASTSKSIPQLGFYLAPPNLVESVHLPSTLSPDLAIVHTTSGSAIVLRETGQLVGSEDEGVMEVWKELLGCDDQGSVTKVAKP